MKTHIQQYRCFNCQLIIIVTSRTMTELTAKLEDHLIFIHGIPPTTLKDLFDNYDKPITIN